PERMGSRGSPLTREGDPDLTSLTVLVVDDEPDARDIMRRMLENAGASVQTAASVPEAMHLVECTRFSVLVSDISMPGQDGYALIGAVRRHADSATRNTPALALTAHARGEDRLRALAAGFQLHVSKPVHAQEFIAAVANISGKRA
ncbi:MAG TPA: response regulator, partial [Polyangiales bacterium]